MNQYLKGSINEIGLCNYLKGKFPQWNFSLTENYSPDDKRGIDIIGKDLFGQVHYLAQCKSSVHQAIKFLDNCLMENIHVYFPDDDGEWREYKYNY